MLIDKHNQWPEILRMTGFCFLLTICLLYWVFFKHFAEINIQFSFLNFPVFVGEMVLGVLLLLLFALKKIEGRGWERWYGFAALYIGWILIKAYLGYEDYGPLAFRTAALFYYPLFLVIAYELYTPRLFNQPFIIALLPLIVLLIKGIGIYSYAWFSYLILYIIFLIHVRNKWIQGFFFLLMFYVFSYKGLFMGTRTYMLSTGASLAFIVSAIVFGVLNIKKKYKIILFCSLSLILMFCAARYAYLRELKGLMISKKFMDILKHKEKVIAERSATFQYQPITPHVFAREETGFSQYLLHRAGIDKIERDETQLVKISNITQKIIIDSVALAVARTNEQSAVSANNQNVLDQNFKNMLERNMIAMDPDNVPHDQLASKIKRVVNEAVDTLKEDEMKKQIRYPLAVNMAKAFTETMTKSVEFDEGVEYSNLLFRYFIWRDMVREMIAEKAFWGISFGKPQRSISIEITTQAQEEWKRDGWIAPHNSLLHMIYRGGIMGLLLVLTILGGFGLLIKKFIVNKSVVGILLCSILIYWIVFSNTSVILELPYSAIPFWTLFGMAIAYSKKFPIKVFQWNER